MKMREVISVANTYNDGLTANVGLTAVICVTQVPPTVPDRAGKEAGRRA
jgi:hypothetical protein